MKLRLMSTGLMLTIPVLIMGCASSFTVHEATERALREHDAKLSKEYLEKLSIISGRLDGMNKAIVSGLTESLDTSRTAREMAEEALAISRENKKALQTGESMSSAGPEESGEEEFQFTPMED